MAGETDPGLAAILGHTVTWLSEHGARTELLARLRRRRGLLGLTGGSSLVPQARAWRLGVLLLDVDGRLYTGGTVTRSVEPRHPNYQSVSGEERRELRRMAFESGLPAGEVVTVDPEELPLDRDSLARGSGPLSLDGDRVVVSWAPGQRSVDLSRYLDERARLLRQRDGWDDGTADTIDGA